MRMIEHPLFEQEWRAIHKSYLSKDGLFCRDCQAPCPWSRDLCVECAKRRAAKNPRLVGLSILARGNASKRSRRMGKFVPIIPDRYVEFR